MSAFALVTGTIFRAPVQKISKAGKPFTTCTVKAGSDDSASSDFWSIICFSESAQLEMLRLEVGDAISIRGKMELKTYVANDGQTKISRSIFADAALGLRPAPRTPKAKAAAKSAPASQEQSSDAPTGAPPFDDDIPFLMEWRG
jgi:single-stranded DNA-binding protein